MGAPEEGLALEGKPGEARVKVRVVRVTLYNDYLVAAGEYLLPRED